MKMQTRGSPINKGAIFALLLLISGTSAFPDMSNSLIASTSGSTSDKPQKEGVSKENSLPQIYQMHVRSDISNRFANTTVTSKVKNFAAKAQEATFSVVLPENAFISGFIMEVDGKNYTAYVKEKEEAKKTYDEAVASGLAAAHVAVSARDSNRFTVSVNVEPEAKAAFYLTYEELLQRKNGHYELIINLHPGQPVEDLSVEVAIAESRKLTSLKAPPLRSGNEIGNENDDLDPRADTMIVNDTSAIIKFSPNLERQKQVAHLMGTKEEEGLAGQFVVQYDVERDPKGGEVLIQDGYFVHFFAPSELTSIPKHVVFVLDTSSSMYGQKIQQLREAMLKILGQLNEKDLFHLVEFNSLIKVWAMNDSRPSVEYENGKDIKNYSFPEAIAVNADNIKKAKTIVSGFRETGATDIHSALMVALRLIELTKEANVSKIEHQPMIIFLTDGEPTVGVVQPETIISEVTEMNAGKRKTPLFTLSFGDGADKDFLQKLSLRNSGFSKHIYEAADSALQLEDFYKQISSPLLSDVTFKYQPSATSLTETEFPILFDGSEIVVAGFYETDELDGLGFAPGIVDAWVGDRYIDFTPVVRRSVSSVERLWAYLTIKQLLQKKEVSDEGVEALKKKALDLALQYSFVTPLTSLVVVKPNVTSDVDPTAADKASVASGYLGSQLGDRGGIALSGAPLLASYDSGGFIDFRVEIDSEDDYEQFLTTEIPTEILSTTTLADHADIYTALPWLQGVLNENRTLTLTSGTYKLGLDENIPTEVSCSNAPNNTTCNCSLLSDCPSLHPILTSLKLFEDHFCVLQKEYAGVCCPDASLKQNTSDVVGKCL